MRRVALAVLAASMIASPAAAESRRSIAEIVLATKAAAAADQKSGDAAKATDSKKAVVVTPSGNASLVVVRGSSRLERGRSAGISRHFTRRAHGDRFGRGYSRYNRSLGNDRRFSAGFRSGTVTRRGFTSLSKRGVRIGGSRSAFNRGYRSGLRTRGLSSRRHVGRR